MLNITVLCDHAHISGGAAKVALQSAMGLARRGHRVTLIAAVGPVSAELEESGVTVCCFGERDIMQDRRRLNATVRGLWNSSAARQLRTALQAAEAGDSIVHLHSWTRGFSPSIGAVLSHAQLRGLYSIHEYFIACPNGAFYNYTKHDNCYLRPMSAACAVSHCDSRTYAHKVWRILRHGMPNGVGGLRRAFRHFAYLSDLQREVLSPYLPDGCELHRLPNPIQVPDAGPPSLKGDGPFLFVGRLSHDKGVLLLAEAAKQLGVRVVFVGSGDLEGELRSRYSEVEITGWLSPDEVYERMRCARALVLPSVWYECQPLTAYEALSQGLPVVTSENNAAREAIVPGETGLLFHNGDADDLAAKMRELLCNDTVAMMSAKAYQSYWNRPLTLDYHLDKLEQIYEKVWRDTTRR